MKKYRIYWNGEPLDTVFSRKETAEEFVKGKGYTVLEF